MLPLTTSATTVVPDSGALKRTTASADFLRPFSRQVPSYFGLPPAAMASRRMASSRSVEQVQ